MGKVDVVALERHGTAPGCLPRVTHGLDHAKKASVPGQQAAGMGLSLPPFPSVYTGPGSTCKACAC